MRRLFLNGLLLGSVLLTVGLSQPALAVEESQQISSLETRVTNLENRISHHAGEGAVMMLFGAFCALWAQNSGRNPWLWFFLGLFFSIITVLFVLSKNSQDRARPATGAS